MRKGDVVIVNRPARPHTVHTFQLVEKFNRRGIRFQALGLGIGSRTPAGKMIIGVFSSFNQYKRENNREKSLAGIGLAKQQGKHLSRPTGRDAGKVARALAEGLSVAPDAGPADAGRASVRRYRRELQAQIQTAP